MKRICAHPTPTTTPSVHHKVCIGQHILFILDLYLYLIVRDTLSIYSGFALESSKPDLKSCRALAPVISGRSYSTSPSYT